MSCIEQIWLATEAMDMRAGAETSLARVVKQFGEARVQDRRGSSPACARAWGASDLGQSE